MKVAGLYIMIYSPIWIIFFPATFILSDFIHIYFHIYIYIYICYIYISSSYRAGSTDIPDPLSPLLPIVHRPRYVFRTTSRILT